MSKKKSGQWLLDDDQPEAEVEAPEPAAEEPNIYFKLVSWKDIKQVYQCATCGDCRDDRDAMVMHVLLHEPAAEQNRVFETLMKEQ